MKSSQTRIRVNQDDTEILRELSEKTGLQQVDLSTMLLHSALSAVREYRGPVPLVIRFKIETEKQSDCCQLNEPKPPHRK